MTTTLEARHHDGADTARRTLCSFWLGDLLFALDVADVQEVLRPHTLTAVPTAPEVVTGLMNLRGQIVVTCDVRHRFGLGHVVDAAGSMTVVLRTPDGPLALLVDRIGEVIEVPVDGVEPTPSTVDPAIARLLVGAHQLPDRLLLEIATGELVAALTPNDL